MIFGSFYICFVTEKLFHWQNNNKTNPGPSKYRFIIVLQVKQFFSFKTNIKRSKDH